MNQESSVTIFIYAVVLSTHLAKLSHGSTDGSMDFLKTAAVMHIQKRNRTKEKKTVNANFSLLLFRLSNSPMRTQSSLSQTLPDLSVFGSAKKKKVRERAITISCTFSVRFRRYSHMNRNSTKSVAKSAANRTTSRVTMIMKHRLPSRFLRSTKRLWINKNGRSRSGKQPSHFFGSSFFCAHEGCKFTI